MTWLGELRGNGRVTGVEERTVKFAVPVTRGSVALKEAGRFYRGNVKSARGRGVLCTGREPGLQ